MPPSIKTMAATNVTGVEQQRTQQHRRQTEPQLTQVATVKKAARRPKIHAVKSSFAESPSPSQSSPVTYGTFRKKEAIRNNVSNN